MHKLAESIVGRIIVRSCSISYYHSLQTIDTFTKFLHHRTAKIRLSYVAAVSC